MGREIDVRAENRLRLQDAGRVTPKTLTLLLDAFTERQRQVGGRALILDAVVEIARARGYRGTVNEAASLLQAAGCRVETGPSGRLTVWRPE